MTNFPKSRRSQLAFFWSRRSRLTFLRSRRSGTHCLGSAKSANTKLWSRRMKISNFGYGSLEIKKNRSRPSDHETKTSTRDLNCVICNEKVSKFSQILEWVSWLFALLCYKRTNTTCTRPFFLIYYESITKTTGL